MRRTLGMLLVIAAIGGAGAANAAPLEYFGSWIVKLDQDPFTDEVTGAAYVLPEGSDLLSLGFGLGLDPVLGVMCRPDDVNAFGVLAVLVNTDFMREGMVDVIYRVDSKPAVNASWRATSRAAGPMPDQAKDFLQELVGGEKLVLRISAYSSTPTYTFKVTGFSDAMRALGCYTGPL